MKKITSTVLLALFILPALDVTAQERDTLKLSIIRVEKKIIPDTVYSFSTRVDTVALQPVKTDTSKIVKDVNPQDLEEMKYHIKLMGNIRVNSYYDLNGMTSTEGFLPYDIPVGEETVEGLSSVYIGARQSRFGVEGTANTKVGQIRTYLEVDFASSTGSFWRLRHAFAEWNFLKLGYTWSTFLDNASIPNTVDFEGPNSALSKKSGIIRYERKFGEKSIAGLSLEAPESDYTNPADSLITNKSKQSNFDIAGRYKRLNKWGHIQLAGIFRRIDYLHKDKMDVMYGWGLLLSTAIRVNPKHNIFSQYSFGEGIANYYVGFNNRKLDAVYDPNTDNMTLKQIQGGFVTYTYILNPSWRFSMTGGISFIKGKDFEPPETFKSSRYIAANVFYDPIETISLGFEVTSGSRTNLDSQTGHATRISAIASFNF
jgi:hypothetical protein